MESTQTVGKRSMRLRFIILQLLTLLLVAVVLFSFSNAPLEFFGGDKGTTVSTTSGGKQEANPEALKALENNLVTYQNLVKEKDQKISELEAGIKSMQASNGTSNNSAAETALRNDLQKKDLELSEKEATINELVLRIQTLEKAKAPTTASSDKALVDRLRGEIEKLETRNALLVKLNNDLKKNNEFLSSQQKQ